MKEYVIKKVETKPLDWDQVPKAEIDAYRWMDNGYAPRVRAALCYNRDAIYIKFWAYETEIRGTHKTHNEQVCEDSCVEFFFHPNSDPNFFNIETNVLGTQLIGFGPERNGRTRVEVEDDVMQIIPSVKDAEGYDNTFWTVEYRVPFSFLKRFYGDLDIVKDGLRANLCKCGDLTRYEHYGMWNEIEIEEPDYHRPDWFGKMTFEQ
ncbi:MAG: hypothetical protein IJN25_04690 [Clostridia bacterium]|nr:hypothetical protein [Oscillospiraceae bacterium]MBQ7032941.1 hypothetical protein [Clostridia bacterium]